MDARRTAWCIGVAAAVAGLGGCSSCTDFESWRLRPGSMDAGSERDGGPGDTGADVLLECRDCGPEGSCVAGVCYCGDLACFEPGACCGGGSCTNLNADPRNCGSCGNVCGEGESCAMGICVCGGEACGPGTRCCGGNCLDVSTDVLRCGGCDTVCPEAPGAVRACVGGSCTLGCEPGFANCEISEPDCETSLALPSSCGACTTECGGTEVCALDMMDMRVCASGCGAGTVDCGGGVCADVTGDVEHCGDCATRCATLANATRACVGGSCTYACAAGFDDCDRDLGRGPDSNGCEETLTLFYRDADGDGFGGATGTAMPACAGMPPAGTVPNRSDCNDADRAVSPGAPEECNSRDDDCDASVDEGITAPTGEPVGASCRCMPGAAAGMVACVSDTSAACVYPPETCNGYDDDCDGSADEPGSGISCTPGTSGTCTYTSGACSTPMGTRLCSSSCSYGTCMPPGEACNGDDDDCDGRIDESVECAFGSARPCTTSCGSTGSQACTMACTWGTCTPPAESCNGTDDDCDMMADETFACVSGSRRSCTTSCGSTGTQVCSSSCGWGLCTAPAEVCNGADDDCDGLVDDGFTCAPGATGPCTTTCGSTGTQTCSSTCAWGLCVNPPESCGTDRDDDDCDGLVDESVLVARAPGAGLMQQSLGARASWDPTRTTLGIVYRQVVSAGTDRLRLARWTVASGVMGTPTTVISSEDLLDWDVVFDGSHFTVVYTLQGALQKEAWVARVNASTGTVLGVPVRLDGAVGLGRGGPDRIRVAAFDTEVVTVAWVDLRTTGTTDYVVVTRVNTLRTDAPVEVPGVEEQAESTTFPILSLAIERYSSAAGTMIVWSKGNPVGDTCVATSTECNRIVLRRYDPDTGLRPRNTTALDTNHYETELELEYDPDDDRLGILYVRNSDDGSGTLTREVMWQTRAGTGAFSGAYSLGSSAQRAWIAYAGDEQFGFLLDNGRAVAPTLRRHRVLSAVRVGTDLPLAIGHGSFLVGMLAGTPRYVAVRDDVTSSGALFAQAIDCGM